MDNRKEERQGLVDAVSFVPMIQSFRNVDVVGKADWMTYLGSSNVVITPCNYAIILKLDSGWSWFITLSACDYPLIRHDGMQILILGISVSLCLLFD